MGDVAMFRIWMLLVVGVAAVREVAEDAPAHYAVKEGSVGPHSFIRNKWQTFRLRFEVEEVAREFGKERQLLTEAPSRMANWTLSSSPFWKAFITACARCCRSFSGNLCAIHSTSHLKILLA